MFYRAVKNLQLSEEWESESFREVYEMLLTDGKTELYADPDREFISFRVYRVAGAVDCVDMKTGHVYTIDYGCKPYGYVQITPKSVIICIYGQKCIWYDREGHRHV